VNVVLYKYANLFIYILNDIVHRPSSCFVKVNGDASFEIWSKDGFKASKIYEDDLETKQNKKPLIIPKIQLYMLMILSLAVSLNMRFNIMLLTAEVLQLKIRQLKQCYLLVTSFLLSPAVSLIQLQKLSQTVWGKHWILGDIQDND